jgi:hypothetical protein
MVPIPDFGLIGTLPKHQFLCPSPMGARRDHFGHRRNLALACDENIAQFMSQIGAGQFAA